MGIRKKLCFSCYRDLLPGESVHIITIGRQCCHCHAATDRGELMVPVEYEKVVLPPLPNAS